MVAIDGNIPQLKAILDKLDMYKEHSFIYNKTIATSSAAEAAVGCCAVFKDIKVELSNHTVRHLPLSQCPTKRKVNRWWSGGLELIVDSCDLESSILESV